MSMLETLNEKTFTKKNPPPPKSKKAAMDKVEVAAYVASDPVDDKKQLRKDELYYMSRRKETKAILEKWDPSLVSAKAKASLTEELERLNKELKEIRKKLGK
jgi:hypothetical protein